MAKNIEEIKAALAEYGITGAKEIYFPDFFYFCCIKHTHFL